MKVQYISEYKIIKEKMICPPENSNNNIEVGIQNYLQPWSQAGWGRVGDLVKWTCGGQEKS